MRRASALVLLVFLAATPLGPADAQVGGPYGSPVRFTPKPETTLSIEGRGPFRGTIEIRREGSRVTIVNELDLDHYVMGVREVPGHWPMEALKAQAVAARTYALWELQKGYWKRFGFDVCATVSCQVYQGATAELGERGRRWSAAVRATSGQVLLESGGAPALTRYHSSSGGRTLNNETVYPTDGARPYLKSIDDPHDKVSPLHEWRVSFKRADLERILREGIGLQGALTDVIVDEPARNLVIKTQGGQLQMTTVRFRREISETAPRVFPDLYPALREDGERMPFTLPSSRFEITKAGDGFVLTGRGYGHGVGMSQWGAMGRASDGASYDEILGAYYGGLRPHPWSGQRTIRVAVVRETDSARVSGNGPFDVTTNGQTVAAPTLGGWSIGPSGIRSVAVTPPQGSALPLALTGVRVPKEVVIDPPEHEDSLDVGFVVPKPTQITGVLTLDGKQVARERMVFEAGERTLAIRLRPDELARRATYQLSLEAYDGKDRVRESASTVLVTPGMSLFAKLLWALAIVAVVVAGLRWRKRRRLARRRVASRAQTTLEPV
jgi:stage II sporulation protein D